MAFRTEPVVFYGLVVLYEQVGVRFFGFNRRNKRKETRIWSLQNDSLSIEAAEHQFVVWEAVWHRMQRSWEKVIMHDIDCWIPFIMMIITKIHSIIPKDWSFQGLWFDLHAWTVAPTTIPINVSYVVLDGDHLLQRWFHSTMMHWDSVEHNREKPGIVDNHVSRKFRRKAKLWHPQKKTKSQWGRVTFFWGAREKVTQHWAWPKRAIVISCWLFST